jgi:hypothetical protein
MPRPPRGQRPSRSLLHHPRGVIAATDQQLQCRVTRHVNNPEGHWKLLAANSARRPLTIPTSRESPEKALHAGRHAESVTEHLGHLAHRDDVLLMTSSSAGKADDALNRPNRTGSVRIRQGTQDPSHGLRRRTEDDRVEVLEQGAVGEQRGGDVSVGRATGVEEQTAVVRLSRRLNVDPQPVDQAQRDQRALKTVLEGQPDRQIRCQAHGSDYLSGAHLVTSCRGRLHHDLTLHL